MFRLSIDFHRFALLLVLELLFEAFLSGTFKESAMDCRGFLTTMNTVEWI